MNIKIGDKCLISVDNYFVAPDGKQYRSVFGTVNAVVDAESVLGIKTNDNSTNWYVEIGNMIIAGCQIHYVVQTDDANFLPVRGASWSSKGLSEFTRPSLIYNADNEA